MLKGGNQRTFKDPPQCALPVVFQGSKVLALEKSAPCLAAGGATPHVQLMLVAGETVRMLNDQWVLVVKRENQDLWNDMFFFVCFDHFKQILNI